MSGFIAIYHTDNTPIQPRLLSSLVESLKFRGPDRQHIWIDGSIGLGHALFQTTNEAKYEKQPATIDSKVWITCSARIDDRENLVSKLGMKKEINLSKTPDSELILHAYRKWGEDCLEHLLGDFAFVIWDDRNKKLFCARDHFGKKQFYYAFKKGTFIACNTLGTMRKHPNISKELNEKTIGAFLLFGSYTWYDKSLTMFQDITVLLPAHKLTVQNGKISVQRYWDIPENIPLLNYKNQQDYIDHFLDVFKVAVSDRIRTDSIAISMSGGMDSTSIAAIAKQLQNEKNHSLKKLQAVTMVHDNMLIAKERYYVDIAAKHIGLPLHHIVGDAHLFLHPTLPTTHPLEIPQPGLWLEAEKTLQKFSRVVLVGDAADELFKYPSTPLALKEVGMLKTLFYAGNAYRQYGKKLPLGLGIKTKFKKLFSLNKNTNNSASYPYPNWIDKEFEERIDLKEMWERMWQDLQTQQTIHTNHTTLQWSLANASWCSEDLLMENDYTLSETRDPYLDLRMVEFTLGLPALPWLFNKHILRTSMKGFLPDAIRYRPKTPLGHLEHALIQQSQNQWVTKWNASKAASYIDKNFFFSLTDSPAQHYLKSRAIILDQWLNDL